MRPVQAIQGSSEDSCASQARKAGRCRELEQDPNLPERPVRTYTQRGASARNLLLRFFGQSTASQTVYSLFGFEHIYFS